jgi:regulator of sigma E protease
MGIVQPIVTIVLFFLILGTLVVIHELGHFVAARVAGVRVLEFGIGFPPRAKVLRSKGETLYTLNWLPIGGFVKLEGEDGDHANDPRAFSSKSLPIRLFILVSGVVMNVLLAFVIFTGIVWLASPQVGAKFAEVQPDSPAAAAGLQAGDTIVAVGGERFQVFVGPDIVDVLRANAGQTITITVLAADGATREVTATLRDPSQIDANHGALGIGQIEFAYDGSTTSNDLATAIRIGWEQTIRWMGLIIGGLGSLVSAIFTNPTAPPPVSGPIGIATQIGDVFFTAGPVFTLFVAGILSANLAVVNILPFPPLDGGRMLMITLKRIFGSRISVRAEQLTYLVGFVFLFAFIIWVSGFDLVRTLGGGPPPPAP